MIDAEELKNLLITNQVIPIRFANQRMLLDANGVLVWPKHQLLIFSDLHLEKGSFLSQFANPLPRFDSAETIKRMVMMCQQYQCSHIVCLGDSFHDSNALSRMQSEDLKQLNLLIESTDKWTWVLGNHDPDIPEIVKGERQNYLIIDNILLVHEPENLTEFDQIDAQIIGHFHPKSSHKLANRKVTGKSFVSADNLLLMPAFGKYTGGLDIKDEAFNRLFQLNNAQIYMTYNRKIYMM